MKINYNPCRHNTGAETEPNPNMWREDQPRAPPPTARPATTAPSSSSTAQAAKEHGGGAQSAEETHGQVPGVKAMPEEALPLEGAVQKSAPTLR